MEIRGIEGLTGEQINYELQRGGKFVIYQYCISLVILTYRRGSDIYFIQAGDSAFLKGFKYSLLSLVLGWWGFPWGPIYTIGSIIQNCAGGKDVTQEVIQALNSSNDEEQEAV